jgi:hypothetical protein
MRSVLLLGAAVVAASALARPAGAQPIIDEPAYCENFYPYANCQNLGPGNPYTGVPAGGWRDDRDNRDDRNNYAYVGHERSHHARHRHHHHMH